MTDNDDLRQPVAWIQPNWQDPANWTPYSPVTVYPRKDWLPLYLSATPIEPLQQRVERLEDLLRQRDGGTHDQDCKVHRGLPCNCLHDEVVAALGDDVG